MTRPELVRIYDAYHAKVVAHAARLLGASEAEDAAQDVFIKVGRALGTLAEPAKLSSWIYAITLNTVRDALRRRRTHPDRCPADADSRGPGEPAVARLPDTRARSPEQVVARNEMVACYLGYVQRLAPSYYEVYALSEFDDLTALEIARRLSLPLATVKIRLHRARARVHEELRRNCRSFRNERGELMGEPPDR